MTHVPRLTESSSRLGFLLKPLCVVPAQPTDKDIITIQLSLKVLNSFKSCPTARPSIIKPLVAAICQLLELSLKLVQSAVDMQAKAASLAHAFLCIFDASLATPDVSICSFTELVHQTVLPSALRSILTMLQNPAWISEELSAVPRIPAIQNTLQGDDLDSDVIHVCLRFLETADANHYIAFEPSVCFQISLKLLRNGSFGDRQQVIAIALQIIWKCRREGKDISTIPDFCHTLTSLELTSSILAVETNSGINQFLV